MLSVAFHTDRTKPFIDTQNQADTQTPLTDRETSHGCSDRTDVHKDRDTGQPSERHISKLMQESEGGRHREQSREFQPGFAPG